MDLPFPLHHLHPTALPQPPDSPLASPAGSFCTAATTSLIEELTKATKALACSPYDPVLWLSRSKRLRELGYPELALADAWKTSLLCDDGLTRLDTTALGSGRWSLGKGRGFWMLAEEDEDPAEIERPLFEWLREKATSIERQLTPWDEAKQERTGWYVPQPYPWLEAKHAKREPEVADRINAELEAGKAQRPDGGGAWLACRPCIFPAIDGRDTNAVDIDALGLFATCDIPANTRILRDESVIFGCAGQSGVKSFARKSLPSFCRSESHPNLPSDVISSSLAEFAALTDGTLSNPLATLLLLRALLSSVQTDGPTASPLSHGPLARLKPAYHTLQPRPFTLADLSMPLLFLQSLGVDVFAPPASDLFAPWVLLTITARLDNNAWSSPTSLCLGGLFCMLNHSCEANARWVQDKDGCRSLSVWTKRAVKEGEEVTVEYDEFAGCLGVRERRERLGRWIEGGCGCGRCARESGEAEMGDSCSEDKVYGETKPEMGEGWESGRGAAWDSSTDAAQASAVFW